MVVALAALSLAASASAQQPAPGDPVMVAYKEFLAARDRKDAVGAASAAERAWRASEAESGAGGKTAILALNAAIARLAVRAADAVDAAHRAVDLAEAGDASVDPVRARLVLGQALLDQDYREAKKVLVDALEQARGPEGERRLEASNAASALAEVSTDMFDWPIASKAWTFALDYGRAGSSETDIVRRVQAFHGRGIALAAQHKDSDALQSFLQGARLLEPFAPEREDDSVTTATRAYAQAYGWASAVAARMRAEGKPVPNFALVRPGIAGKPQLCALQLQILPKPAYPIERDDNFGFAGFTLKLSVDEAGSVVGSTFLASNPYDNFAPAFLRFNPKWKVTRTADSPPGCRMESADHIVTVAFSR